MRCAIGVVGVVLVLAVVASAGEGSFQVTVAETGALAAITVGDTQLFQRGHLCVAQAEPVLLTLALSLARAMIINDLAFRPGLDLRVEIGAFAMAGLGHALDNFLAVGLDRQAKESGRAGRAVRASAAAKHAFTHFTHGHTEVIVTPRRVLAVPVLDARAA